MKLRYILPILLATAFGTLHASTIHELIDQGDSAAVAAMLDADPSLLDNRLPNGRSPLHSAAYGGKQNIVALLIGRGADVNAQTTAGATPLHGSALAGFEGIVRLLVEKGANPSIANQFGYTPLTNAASSGSIPSMKCLIDAGASVNPKTGTERVPLVSAVQRGKTDCAEYLLRAGANPNAVSPEGESALLMAVFAVLWNLDESDGVPDLLQLLLTHGADANHALPSGNTPLMTAVRTDDTTILRILLDGGARPDAVSINGSTAFTDAVESGCLNSAKYLIRRNAHKLVADIATGYSPLHYAVLLGELPMVETVLSVTDNPSAVDSLGTSPLDLALRYGHKQIADLLKRSGATATGKGKHTPSSMYLAEQPTDGEAYLWYLGNCGYMIKTSNHCLVFDYWTRGLRPIEPSISNGFINPKELAEENVTVFVTHEHRDHFDSTIFGWPSTIPKLTYVFGFQPESLDVNMRQGFTNQPYEYVGPAMTKTLDGMQVLAVRSNDAGAGYVVKVDGLTIYHAGDLAGWRPNERDGFISQIDSIDAIFDSVDIALVNVTGCHHQDTLALVEGTEYTIGKLQPKLIIPTHGFMREKYYRQFMNKFAGTYPDLLSFCPVWRGDAIKFSGGGKPARTELL